MKLVYLVLLASVSFAYANPAVKPAFPTTLGKAKKNLDQIAWILKDPGKGYCQEAQKLDELLGKLTKAEERATIEGEQRFSKVVCKDGKYVGLSEPGMDKNTFVVANVQILKLSLATIFLNAKSIAGEGTMALHYMNRLDTEQKIFLDEFIYEAYRKDQSDNLIAPLSDVSKWVREIRKFYSAAN